MVRGAAGEAAAKGGLAQAIRYALSNWTALTRYTDDGRLEIDNNRAENTLRGVALGRKNWLFAGSDAGGDRAAAIYSLIETCKLAGIDPLGYLRDVLARIAHHKISRSTSCCRGIGRPPPTSPRQPDPAKLTPNPAGPLQDAYLATNRYQSQTQRRSKTPAMSLDDAVDGSPPGIGVP